MQLSQFTTLSEAKQIADKIGTEIGGGVAAYNESNSAKSGIYIPEYGRFGTPEDGDRKFYHFRFNSGVDGFNVGLIKGSMLIFPTRWPLMLAQEVESAHRLSVDD